MVNINPTQTRHTETHKRLAAEYLRLSQNAYEEVVAQRIYWVHLARKYGLTWKQIGDALTITGDGARQLAKRNPQEEA